MPRIFHKGGGQDRMAKGAKGWERGWGSWRGAATPSPPARGSGGVLWASPAGYRVESWPPKGFLLFSALRMASRDTIILLIVDYYAAIGGQDPHGSPCVCPCFFITILHRHHTWLHSFIVHLWHMIVMKRKDRVSACLSGHNWYWSTDLDFLTSVLEL